MCRWVAKRALYAPSLYSASVRRSDELATSFPGAWHRVLSGAVMRENHRMVR